MSLELISTAEHYGEAIDCRCLSFAFEFYQMSDKLIVDLSTEMVLWLNSFLKDGFISKRFEVVYNLRNLLLSRIQNTSLNCSN